RGARLTSGAPAPAEGPASAVVREVWSGRASRGGRDAGGGQALRQHLHLHPPAAGRAEPRRLQRTTHRARLMRAPVPGPAAPVAPPRRLFRPAHRRARFTAPFTMSRRVTASPTRP